MQHRLRHSGQLGNRIGTSSGGAFDWAAYWATRYPSGLIITINSASGITLAHTNNGTQDYDAISYEASSDGGKTFAEVTTALPNVSSKAITGLSRDVLLDLYYRIRYRKGANYSPYSNIAEKILRYKPSALIAGWKFDYSDEFQNTLSDFSTMPLCESAIYYNGKTYITYQGADDDPYITTYTHSTGLWATPVKVGTNPLAHGDGHGQPSMLIDSSGYIHIAFGAHNSAVQYAISTNPEDISTWVAQASPISGAYPQFVQLSDDTIYLFVRSSAYQWSFKTSTNEGATWSAATQLTNNFAYCQFRKGVGDTIHCVLNGNDTTGLDRYNIYYMIFSGGSWKNISGAVQALPVVLAGNNIIAYDSGTYNLPMPTIGFDSLNNPYFIFTLGATESDPGTYDYYFTKWTGSAWLTPVSLGVSTGRWRNINTNLDVKSTSVIETYLVTGGADAYQGGNIEKWKSVDGGITWAKVDTIMNGKFIDPIIVKDYHKDAVVWFGEFAGDAATWTRRAILWGNGGLVKNASLYGSVAEIGDTYRGVLAGPPAIVAGNYGKAFSFVNDGDCIEINDNDIFSFNGGSPDKPFSVAFWAKTIANTNQQWFIAKTNKAASANNTEWRILMVSNVIYLQCFDPTSSEYIFNAAPFATTGVFTHLCYTYDGLGLAAGIKILQNAIEIQNNPAASANYVGMSNKDAPVRMGCQISTNMCLKGIMDEVKIFNIALSTTQAALVRDNDPLW